MMKNKKLWLLLGILLILIFSFGIYWFYFSKPVTFPKDEELIKEIQTAFQEASPDRILDSIKVDEEHYFVPFISKDNEYGTSYWVWERHKWRLAKIDSRGTPLVWKIDKNNPSTYYLVWNFHPDDQVKNADIHLFRRRSFQISEGVDTYIPGIQMKQKISLQEKSFGVMKMPNDWLSLLYPFIKVQSSNSSLELEHYFTIGWTTYDSSGKIKFPENSVNGESYSTGVEIETDFAPIIDDHELEIPE
jgi:hypothetical protein